MNESNKISLRELKANYSGLLIPEIQRDYVMGSGGEKLDNLLNAIFEKNRHNEDFDFSCIITYCKNEEENNAEKNNKEEIDNKLQIYDGQQRLTTLLIMVLYKLHSEGQTDEAKTDEAKGYKDWFKFSGRDNANEILNSLAVGDEGIYERKDNNLRANINVTDFTSFSIKNLLDKFCVSDCSKIKSDYFLNRVKFDMVSIGSQNEIEQFFMDLNSGVKLKDYEIYKAKFTHRVEQLKEEDKSEALEMWAHRIDNEWLDFFDLFADYEHPAEEYEIAFVKYCVEMINIEKQEIQKIKADDKIKRLSAAEIRRIYKIMQEVTRLNLGIFKYNRKSNDDCELKNNRKYNDNCEFKNNCKSENNCQRKDNYKLEGLLRFSWTKDTLKHKGSYIIDPNYDKRGAFWSLDYEKYDCMLYYVIQYVLINNQEAAELKDDVLLWCFITTLDWQVDFQNEYLRLIKILLNNNPIENTIAWYECQDKGQYMYYSKYSACAIPQYYGEHISLEYIKNIMKNITTAECCKCEIDKTDIKCISAECNDCSLDKSVKNNEIVLQAHRDMFLFNYWVINNIKPINLLNRRKIALHIMDSIDNALLKNKNNRENFVNHALNNLENSIKVSAAKYIAAQTRKISVENREKLSNDIKNLVEECTANDSKENLLKIIENTIKKRSGELGSDEKSAENYEEYKKKEDEVLGIGEIKNDDNNKNEEFYLEEVCLTWPVSRNVSHKNGLRCLIRVKCDTDSYFLAKKGDNENNKIVQKTRCKLKKALETLNRVFDDYFYTDRCFWSLNRNTVFRLIPRKGDYSATYNKLNSNRDWHISVSLNSKVQDFEKFVELYP